jgi:hypothetical protein
MNLPKYGIEIILPKPKTTDALVVQWIEHEIPNLEIQVRFLARAETESF